MINANYSAGRVSFDLHDLLQRIPENERREMVESMSCDDEIIRHVSTQIPDRWTESAFSGSSLVTASADGGTPLDKATREVARRSGEVAAREIKRLEDALGAKERQIEMLYEELRKASSK